MEVPHFRTSSLYVCCIQVTTCTSACKYRNMMAASKAMNEFKNLGCLFHLVLVLMSPSQEGQAALGTMRM